MRTWFCLSLIKRNNYRNSSSSQLLASCSNESLESTSINETTADLSATAILFSFLNLACDSADALHSFAPAVMVTDLMNLSSVPLMHRDLCDLESQILIGILPKERTLNYLNSKPWRWSQYNAEHIAIDITLNTNGFFLCITICAYSISNYISIYFKLFMFLEYFLIFFLSPVFLRVLSSKPWLFFCSRLQRTVGHKSNKITLPMRKLSHSTTLRKMTSPTRSQSEM